MDANKMVSKCEHEWVLWVSDIAQVAFHYCKKCNQQMESVMKQENADLKRQLVEHAAEIERLSTCSTVCICAYGYKAKARAEAAESRANELEAGAAAMQYNINRIAEQTRYADQWKASREYVAKICAQSVSPAGRNLLGRVEKMRTALLEEKQILIQACLDCAANKPRTEEPTICRCIITQRIGKLRAAGHARQFVPDALPEGNLHSQRRK
jgi:hypothetical protein